MVIALNFFLLVNFFCLFSLLLSIPVEKNITFFTWFHQLLHEKVSTGVIKISKRFLWLWLVFCHQTEQLDTGQLILYHFLLRICYWEQQHGLNEELNHGNYFWRNNWIFCRYFITYSEQAAFIWITSDGEYLRISRASKIFHPVVSF